MRYCPTCSSPLTEKEIDTRVRLVCTSPTCEYVYWNNPIPVVAMIVEHDDGKIILAHNAAWPEGIFSIITGFLESGEAPEEAAKRETKEELGLDTKEISFVGVFPFARLNQLMLCYHIKATGAIVLNDELDDYKLIEKEELSGYKKSKKFEVDGWLKNRSVLE